MRTLFYYHPDFLEHNPGRGHPERPERLRAIIDGLKDSSLDQQVEWVEPQTVDPSYLKGIHSDEYVERILALDGCSTALDPDTVVSPGSVRAALRAAGAAVEAAKAVLSSSRTVAFCAVRPPGHHAERNRAMGFCLFNNVAIAADRVITEGLARRVVIFDPDLHHGNGTQNAFYRRNDVFYISIHRYPYYPGTGAISETGEGEGQGFTANVPLPGGMGDDDYMFVVMELVLPVMESFRPELLLVSAGFDAHVSDPLGDMSVTESGFVGMYSRIMTKALEKNIKCAFILEGGYDLYALRSSVSSILETLIEEKFEHSHEIRPCQEVQEIVDFVIERLRI